MKSDLQFKILPQPDDFTCGPTCLHAVYNYFNDKISLPEIVTQTPRLENGGTLAVHLALHALKRDYEATIYTYNLKIFDPTWFTQPRIDLREKLREQSKYKRGHRFVEATKAYLQFLDLGGEIRFEELRPSLLRRYLSKSVPILTGLSSTYLYNNMREFGPNDDDDDIRGEPSGHFVVLCGYDRESRIVTVADPLHPNPLAPTQLYQVNMYRLICSILLGVLTYDDNLLVLQPKQA
ncbi:MAG: C39 family peptidase [Candidatus Hydrogenedentes bacterium]|nr:C39 family peptidase [Candidatus Hydrogenedentota bacterium]